MTALDTQGGSTFASLAGKVVVVTGALSGIGKAVAHRMSREGCVVIGADLRASDALDPDDGLAAAMQVDVADATSVAALAERVLEAFGRVDHLVHCAGIGVELPFLDTPLDVFDRILSVNLRGTFIVGQQFAKIMRDAGGGSIVNFGSISGIIGNFGRAAYGASKGGVNQLSRTMAIDLAQHGIRVNVIAPGPVETPLVVQMHSEAMRRLWLDRILLRRYAQPEEMAGTVAFLCSADASYITGQIIAVDGGISGAALTDPSGMRAA